MLTLTEAWKTAYPTASVGILAMRSAANPAVCPALEARKAALEAGLRERFAGKTRAEWTNPSIVYCLPSTIFRKTYSTEENLCKPTS